MPAPRGSTCRWCPPAPPRAAPSPPPAAPRRCPARPGSPASLTPDPPGPAAAPTPAPPRPPRDPPRAAPHPLDPDAPRDRLHGPVAGAAGNGGGLAELVASVLVRLLDGGPGQDVVELVEQRLPPACAE